MTLNDIQILKKLSFLKNSILLENGEMISPCKADF